MSDPRPSQDPRWPVKDEGPAAKRAGKDEGPAAKGAVKDEGPAAKRARVSLKGFRASVKIVHLVCAICGLKSDEIILMFLFYF